MGKGPSNEFQIGLVAIPGQAPQDAIILKLTYHHKPAECNSSKDGLQKRLAKSKTMDVWEADLEGEVLVYYQTDGTDGHDAEIRELSELGLTSSLCNQDIKDSS